MAPKTTPPENGEEEWVASTAALPDVAETPLPTRLLIVPCLLLLTESICTTMLIPFVGYYVVFLQGWSTEDAGYASGFLIALFMLGQVATSSLWGELSDRYGRKICLLLGVSGCAVSVFLFGLSGSIYSACVWRFVHGCFCGCTLVTKTIVNDITDSTNKAKGFAALSLTWGVGILIGPSVGGMLYDPARSDALSWLGLSEDGFWGRHPAFLPSVVVIIYNIIGVVLCALYMVETNTHAKLLTEMFPESCGGPLRPLLTWLQPALPATAEQMATSDVVVVPMASIDSATKKGTTMTATAEGTLDDGLTCELVDALDSSTDPVAVDVRGTGERASSETPASSAPSPKIGYREAFSDPKMRTALTVSMLVSTGDMLYAETLPLWAISPIANGGLALSAFALGVITLMNSFPAVAANMTFAAALRYVKQAVVPFWTVTQLGYAILTVLVPFAAYLSSSSAFAYTLIVNMISKVFQTWMWASLMMVISRCCTSQNAGAMYGIQQATASMVRCFVPFWGAPLFAWSVSGSRCEYPFHQGWLFVLAAIPLFAGAYLTQSLKLD